MATAELRTGVQRIAKSPFYFNTAAHLVRICRESASNLAELLNALHVVPDDSIFHHTFRTLQDLHFIREGFSNDFAHWAFAACSEVALAEQLASLDVREFTSIPTLRGRLVKIVEDYIQQNPRVRDRIALEPFYFCASDTVVIPTPIVARSLVEFADGIEKVSVHSIHYHFIEARLRLKLTSNDFSEWLENELGLPALAHRLNRIDIYALTLQEVQQQILRVTRAAL